MNKEPEKLKQRIGIDKSILYNFALKDIDIDRLKNAAKNDKKYAKITYNKDSPVKLSNGKGLGKLVVKDRRIGKFTVSFEKNNLNEKQFLNCNLEMPISMANNLQNLNTDEYKSRIDNVFQILKEDYGISADHETIRIKKLELNATFYLEEPFEKYKKPILLIMRNAPPGRWGNKNNQVKYGSWHESVKDAENLETVLLKNASTELRIYNKGKQLLDEGAINDLPQDAMRIEYTVKDRRILKNAFEGNMVSNLSDEKINSLFKQYFERDIKKPYQKWEKENHKQLVDLTKKHRASNQKWTANFFRECRQYEATHGTPILFDINDMAKVLKELEPKNGRNARKKFNKFRKQAIYETDLQGNTSKLREIIDKIMSM